MRALSLESSSLREHFPNQEWIDVASSRLTTVGGRYSPIGRGMLTGQIKSAADIPEGDIRRMSSRFHAENFDVNIKLVNRIEQLAKKKGCTPAQLALGWLVSLSKRPGMPTIVPIPGSTTPERVEENANAVELTDLEMKEIGEILSSHQVVGDRYPPAFMKMVNG